MRVSKVERHTLEARQGRIFELDAHRSLRYPRPVPLLFNLSLTHVLDHSDSVCAITRVAA